MFFPVNNFTKYGLRLAVPLVAVIILIACFKAAALPLLIYKCCLILVAFILAEAIWLIGFKRTFGQIEREGITDESKRSILIFRGILYAAIILGLTLGL